MLSRRRFLYTFGGSVLLLAGCRDRGENVLNADDYNRFTQEFVARRNGALKSGEEAAWLKGVDPSNQALVKHEKMFFANLRKVGFEQLEFVTEPYPLVPEPQRYTKSLTHEHPIAYKVSMRSKLSFDRVASEADYTYIFGLVGDTWTLLDFGPDTEDADTRYDAPWDLNALKVVKAGDVLLAADSSVKDFEKYAKVAARASREVRALWGKHASLPGFAVFLTQSQKNYGSWYGKHDPSRTEGMEMTLREKGNIEQYAGARVIINLANSLKGGDPFSALKHEMTHAIGVMLQKPTIALPGAGGALEMNTGVPTWAVEGFATYFENRGVPRKVANEAALVGDGIRKGLLRGDLPRNKGFYDGDEIYFNYAVGWSIFDFLARAKGHETAVAVYVDLLTHPAFDNMQGADALFDSLYRLKLQSEPFVDTRNSKFWAAWKAHVSRF